MPINLMTLTLANSMKVDINPALIETVEVNEEGKATVVMASGRKFQVLDAANKIRERANFRSPDGFG